MSEEKKDNKNRPKSPSDMVREEIEKKRQTEADELKFNKDGIMYIKLSLDDSALVVRSDGTIDMISHDLEKSQDGYVGDVEDLNKTFSLVLALASALENEDLYNRIFHNLNMTLMQRWEQIPDSIKDDIVEQRDNELRNMNPEEKKDKDKRVNEFRKRMNKYKDKFLTDEKQKLIDEMKKEADFREQYSDDFDDPASKDNMIQKFEEHLEHMENMPPEDVGPRREKPKIKKRKRNPLGKLVGIDWNPYDESLKAHFKDWHADEPPKLEDDE